MSISIQCPACGREYNLTERFAGQRVRCKQCGGPIDVPGAAAPAERQAAPRPANRGPAVPPQNARPTARPAAKPTQARPAAPRPAAPALSGAPLSPVPRLTPRKKKSSRGPIFIALGAIAGFAVAATVVVVAALKLLRSDVPAVAQSQAGSVAGHPQAVVAGQVTQSVTAAPSTTITPAPPTSPTPPTPTSPALATLPQAPASVAAPLGSQAESAEELLKQIVAGFNEVNGALAMVSDANSAAAQAPVIVAAFERLVKVGEKLAEAEVAPEEKTRLDGIAMKSGPRCSIWQPAPAAIHARRPCKGSSLGRRPMPRCQN